MDDRAYRSNARTRAERRRCPNCRRKGALRGPLEWLEDYVYRGTAYECRYCGYVKERPRPELR